MTHSLFNWLDSHYICLPSCLFVRYVFNNILVNLNNLDNNFSRNNLLTKNSFFEHHNYSHPEIKIFQMHRSDT